jgi:sec-independent protein translocase protein TatA
MNLLIICSWVPGGGELIIILLALVFMFGGAKIPELMKGLGKGIKEFKNATKDDDEPKKQSEKLEK